MWFGLAKYDLLWLGVYLFLTIIMTLWWCLQPPQYSPSPPPFPPPPLPLPPFTAGPDPGPHPLPRFPGQSLGGQGCGSVRQHWQQRGSSRRMSLSAASHPPALEPVCGRLCADLSVSGDWERGRATQSSWAAPIEGFAARPVSDLGFQFFWPEHWLCKRFWFSNKLKLVSLSPSLPPSLPLSLSLCRDTFRPWCVREMKMCYQMHWR